MVGGIVAVRCVRQAAVNSNFCKSYMCRNCNGQIRDARDHLLHLICEPLSLILVDDDDDDDDFSKDCTSTQAQWHPQVLL